MQKAHVVLALFLMAAFLSCRNDEPVNAPDDTSIFGRFSVEFTVSGGFAGGIHTQLSIDPSGAVILGSAYPPIQGKLTTTEQSALSNLARNIWVQPDTLRGGCADDFTFLIQWTDLRGTKIVSVDGCALMQERTPKYPVLIGFVQILNSVASRIFQEGALWRGVVAEYAINDSSYPLDKPITLKYTLRNPTELVRTLSFPHGAQFWFTVSQDNVPGFHYFYPMSVYYPRDFPDSSPPSSISLNAGDQKVLQYSWDHSVVDSKGVPGVLGAGTYHLQMGMLAGDFAVQNVVFDVYDRNIPVKGEIIPDYGGADLSSATYVFQLRVTNWTATAVTLHFPNTQRIALELWDLDFDPPTTIVYATDLSPLAEPQRQVLAPGESYLFTEAVAKSAIKPGYFWTLAKMRLLCTDFAFERDGQLQIFR